MGLRIQQVEKEVGIRKSNIRYYEEKGLLRPERDRENQYRLYTERDVQLLKKIKFLRTLGLSVREIRQLQTEQISLSELVEQRRQAVSLEKNRLEATELLCREILEKGYSFSDLDVKRMEAFGSSSPQLERAVLREDRSGFLRSMEQQEQLANRCLEVLGTLWLFLTLFFRIQLGRTLPLWFLLAGLMTAGSFGCWKLILTIRRKKQNHKAH